MHVLSKVTVCGILPSTWVCINVSLNRENRLASWSKPAMEATEKHRAKQVQPPRRTAIAWIFNPNSFWHSPLVEAQTLIEFLHDGIGASLKAASGAEESSAGSRWC
jgi:hypothetical protein